MNNESHNNIKFSINFSFFSSLLLFFLLYLIYVIYLSKAYTIANNNNVKIVKYIFIFENNINNK